MTTLPANGNGGSGGGHWPKANPLRGMVYTDDSLTTTYVDHALDFIGIYPIHHYLTQRTFDEWLESRGLLIIPPEGTPKDADPWLGHLYRRTQHRKKLNLAATHPRMYELESRAFYVAVFDEGYQVREPHNHATRQGLIRRINSLTTTKRKQIEYLMQSTDWINLPPWEKIVAENLYEDLRAFEGLIYLQADQIESKYQKLQGRLRQALARGEISSTNGGIARLITDQTILDFDADNEDPEYTEDPEDKEEDPDPEDKEEDPPE